MPSASISPQIKSSRRQPKAPAVPAPSPEIVAAAKRKGFNIIECIVDDVRIGYYCFLDGEWLGRNRRGGLPTSYQAAYDALSAARARQQGVSPEEAAINQAAQASQYTGN